MTKQLLRPYPNESDLENRITKKNIKELKIITYANNVHLSFLWLNHRNFKVNRVRCIWVRKTCWNELVCRDSLHSYEREMSIKIKNVRELLKVILILFKFFFKLSLKLFLLI